MRVKFLRSLVENLFGLRPPGRALALAGVLALAAPTGATGATAPAQPEVTMEFSWLLVDETSGEARLVSGPPPIDATEVMYTARFRYLGADPAEGLRIELPLPEGMRYVPGSATGPGANISYSVDGRVFAPAGELRMPADVEFPATPETPPAVATADDYRFIRWELPGEFPPGVAGLVSFRARAVNADLGDPPLGTEAP